MKNNTSVAFTSIYGDSPHKNYVTSVLETKDGGYILAGNIKEYRTPSVNYQASVRNRKTAGGSDSWLIKTDPAGKETWKMESS